MLNRIALLFTLLFVAAPAMAAPSGCANIVSYGADPTGASDSVGAFNSAWSAAGGGTKSACIYVPAGTYYVSGQSIFTLSSSAVAASLTIVGDGADVSVVKVAAGQTGFKLVLNQQPQSLHVRSLSLVTMGASTSTIGFNVIQNTMLNYSNPAQSDVTGVTVRGSDGYNATNYWGIALNLQSMSNVDIINSAFIGSSGGGASYAGNKAGICISTIGSSSAIPVQINVIGSQSNYCSYGFQYGSYVQGVAIIGSNFVGNDLGIANLSDNQGNDQLAVIGSQFNCGTADIRLSAPIDGVTISGNDFYAAATHSIAIDFDLVDTFSITGNTFIATALRGPDGKPTADGIHVVADPAGVITGNQFKGDFMTCIWLLAGSNNVNVQSNSYTGDCNPVYNQGRNNKVGGGFPIR